MSQDAQQCSQMGARLQYEAWRRQPKAFRVPRQEEWAEQVDSLLRENLSLRQALAAAAARERAPMTDRTNKQRWWRRLLCRVGFHDGREPTTWVSDVTLELHCRWCSACIWRTSHR